DGNDPIHSIVFSREGSGLAAVSNSAVRMRVVLWDINNRQPRVMFEDGRADAATFSANGQLLASAPNDTIGEVRLWDVTTGKRLTTLKGNSVTVECLAFSPDGNILAAGTRDRKLVLWEVKTNSMQEYMSLPGEVGTTELLAYSPDGSLLVFGGGW